MKKIDRHFVDNSDCRDAFAFAPKANQPHAEVTEPPATVAPKKVVLIGAQLFGDKGPMIDGCWVGINCATDFRLSQEN